MNVNADNLRLLLGVKLRQWRYERDMSLKDMAAAAGVSVSYLSEIEAGKKYPTPEKILQIADALGVSFDELVSVRATDDKDPLAALLDSPLLKEFPFDFFGIPKQELVHLVSETPAEAGAFLRTFLEIGRRYDMNVEQFHFAALRSYQKMHGNYFGDIERAAEEFLRTHRLRKEPPRRMQELERILCSSYNYCVAELPVAKFPELTGFRAISVPGRPRKLFLNTRLRPSQRAFLVARELGFAHLGLKEQSLTSTWLRINSFEEVLNNFKASYFAGALMIAEKPLTDHLVGLFDRDRWSAKSFLDIMKRFDATPEMFLYRLSQIIPKHFGMQEMFYLRFHNEAGSDSYTLTKELNMSRVKVPHGIGLDEHYCRRWLALSILRELGRGRKKTRSEEPLAAVQRSRFIDSGAEFFLVTVARPLLLAEKTNSSITLGFLVDETLTKAVRFWNDPAIPIVDVNETCERCRLGPAECRERAAPPAVFLRQELQQKREEALARFLKLEGSGPA